MNETEFEPDAGTSPDGRRWPRVAAKKADMRVEDVDLFSAFLDALHEET